MLVNLLKIPAGPCRCMASWLGLLILLSACVMQPGGALVPVAMTDLPGWSADHVAAAMPALLRSCQRWALLPPDESVGGDGLVATRGGRAGDWAASCAAARTVPPGDDAATRSFLRARLVAYAVPAPVRFTGYYEPELRGALRPSADFDTPVLARPADLVRQGEAVGRLRDGRLEPYPDRAAIEGGALAGQDLELLYLQGRQALFFLQLQGSGRVVLPDGQVVRLVYAGSNGRPYTPIGRLLVQRGALAADGVSMASIRAWLDAHPGAADAVMDANQDYVFFRTDPDAGPGDGPPGTLGVSLVPGRSAAVDRQAVPLGAPLWVSSVDPVDGTPLRRLVLAQDTGTDIRGIGRTDLFFGWGEAAEQRAGRMQGEGREYVLLPRG